MQKQKSTSKKLKNSENKCEFCKKVMESSDSLIKHNCQKKKRWMEKDTKINRIAYSAFERFFKINYPKQKRKEYREFIDSRYYNSFITFAKYLILLENIDISVFIDYIIKNQIPLSDWNSDYVYQSYIKEKIYREDIDDAFIRSMNIIKEWANDNDLSWKDFFKDVDKDYAKKLLSTGKLSPWVVFIFDGENLLSRFTTSDMNDIDFILNVETWNKKLTINKKRMKELRNISKE